MTGLKRATGVSPGAHVSSEAAGAALAFKHPYLYFGAMMCGCFSITAKKKGWTDPMWAKLYMDSFNNWLWCN